MSRKQITLDSFVGPNYSAKVFSKTSESRKISSGVMFLLYCLRYIVRFRFVAGPPRLNFEE